MRKLGILIFCFLLSFLVVKGVACAIDVTTSSATVLVNQPVTFTITDNLTPGYACDLEINFGDSATYTILGNCSDSCSFTVSHTYNAPGTYTVTARRVTGCIAGPDVDTVVVNVRVANLTCTASPSTCSIPRGITTTRTISYDLRTTPAINTAVHSDKGQFIGAGQILGEIKTPLSVRIRNGTGKSSESITIPPGIAKRAEKLKVTRLAYRRTFSDQQVSATVSVFMSITTEAGAEFQITRLRLYFKNNRAEITVKRNYPDLKAYAEVRFMGSGLLRAYWEVDGRILSYVYKHLVYGRSIVFETPSIPALPTFDPGTHILKFVIVEPEQDIPLPTAIYYVTAEEHEKKIVAIGLVSPEADSRIPYSPVRFEWKTSHTPAVFLIEIFAANNGDKPIFSAFTKEQTYKLGRVVLKKLFLPGMSYEWRVKGFDGDRNVVSESKRWRLSFLEPESFVPGQVLVVVDSKKNPEKIIQRLKQKYHFIILESFEVVTLDWHVFVLNTDGDVFTLISKLLKEKGVIIAQPNYIMRTMVEPLSSSQNVCRILKLPMVHERLTGRGVTIAVIDTGIDVNHKDLKDNIASWKNFIGKDTYKPEIHGTAVAGVIAAKINDYGIEGVAPEARIIALRACEQLSKESPEGECVSVCLVKALDNALEMHVDIVNMSFGSKYEDALLSRLISVGAERGTILVAPIGYFPGNGSVSFPASHPDVVAVGGMDEDRLKETENLRTGKKIIYAPSRNILTTVPGDEHNFLSGTSLSSAVVTGIIALAKERDRGIDMNKIPLYEGNICKWEEKILKLPVCGGDFSKP